MATIGTFNSIGGRREQRVVEEGHCLFRVWREQLAEGLADLPKTPHARPQLRGKLLPRLTDRVEHRFGDFSEHVEFTDLMPRARENRCNRPRIQGANRRW